MRKNFFITVVLNVLNNLFGLFDGSKVESVTAPGKAIRMAGIARKPLFPL
jgi:hypothetical protein